jgi:hypothetical protein
MTPDSFNPGLLIYKPARSNRPYPRGSGSNHGLSNVVIGKFAIRLTPKHLAKRHFAEFDFMLRRVTWQGDYRSAIGSPSHLSPIEMALKRLEHFERLERLERDPFLVSIRDPKAREGCKRK